MSIGEAYRLIHRTGCIYGTPEEVKAQLADIAAYLGTKDPTELGAALLLEQAGYERSQLQLSLLAGEEGAVQTPALPLTYFTKGAFNDALRGAPLHHARRKRSERGPSTGERDRRRGG